MVLWRVLWLGGQEAWMENSGSPSPLLGTLLGIIQSFSSLGATPLSLPIYRWENEAQSTAVAVGGMP